jgi:hypothetical protein
MFRLADMTGFPFKPERAKARSTAITASAISSLAQSCSGPNAQSLASREPTERSFGNQILLRALNPEAHGTTLILRRLRRSHNIHSQGMRDGSFVGPTLVASELNVRGRQDSVADPRLASALAMSSAVNCGLSTPTISFA